MPPPEMADSPRSKIEKPYLRRYGYITIQLLTSVHAKTACAYEFPESSPGTRCPGLMPFIQIINVALDCDAGLHNRPILHTIGDTTEL